mmetsp:Transcript_51971/g.103432  ORF Transcript_51971/g.103432 Transcript_51971/m.103432 type:complete len:1106 (-) Transcript_51971:334-3651(-)
MDKVQECVTKCIPQLGDLFSPASEFGPNLAAWSPLTLSAIRERQEANTTTQHHVIGNPSKAKINLRYGWVCQRGLYPHDPDKENQDAYKIIPNFDGEERTILMGVFDGHGEYGDDCSAFVRDNIEKYLSKARVDYSKDLEKSFRSAFRRLNSDMHFQTEFSDDLSGTTAVVAFFERSAVWVANVGDSRAVIAKMQHGELKATPLSTDQTPYRKDERERIRTAGGEIMSVDQREGVVPMHDNWDIDLGAETDTDGDPPRVWVPGKEKPGCAFTRSIGDAMGERVGVIADPELTKKELKEHDKFIIICSDGIWEFLTNQAVVDMVDKHDDPLMACRAVCAKAYELWLQFDVRTDDITMILAYVEVEGKKAKKTDTAKGRGSIRGSISIGGDQLRKGGGARPVRRGLSKAKKGLIASLAEEHEETTPTLQELPKVPKTDLELRRIHTALANHFLFKPLRQEQRDAAYTAIRKRDCEEGEYLFNAGDLADACYIVDSGEFKSVTKQADGKDDVSVIKATTKDPYPVFGEVALLYTKQRANSTFCGKPGMLWVIDRTVFRAVLKYGDIADNSNTRALETLKSIDVFRALSGSQLKKVALGLVEHEFKENEYIVRQNDNTQSLYLIMEGHVKCTKDESEPDGPNLLIELFAGQYFGERSLLHKAPRAANVIATRKTVCLEISKEVFEKELGSLQELIDDDRQKREHIATRRQQRQRELGLMGSDINDFHLEALVLEHDFGQFVSCCHVSNQSTKYTIKAIEKQAAVKLNATARVMQEHKLAQRLVEDSMFVPPLLMTFETDGYLLTLINTSSAMDMHDCMAQYGPFDEATALFYAANIFLGIEFLHGQNIVYRNVNPEAIMLNHLGYATLVDFRSAAECDNDDNHKLFDLIGYYPYLAPEQVSGTGHQRGVDYWALGVLIYEMITEKTPWATGNPAMDTEEAFYSKIASHYTGALQYPDAFSLELVAILDKLLEPTVAQRITTPKEFRANGWCDGVVNWEMLKAGAVPSPFAPECVKQLGEHKKAGTAKVMPQTTYTGGVAWYEGFAPKMASNGTPLMVRPGGASNGAGAIETPQPAMPAVADSPVVGSNEEPKKGKKDKKKDKKFKEASI